MLERGGVEGEVRCEEVDQVLGKGNNREKQTVKQANSKRVLLEPGGEGGRVEKIKFAMNTPKGN